MKPSGNSLLHKIKINELPVLLLLSLVHRKSNGYNHGSSPTSYITTLTVDQPEDVVEDEVASGAVGQELEALSVVHRPLLLVDLDQRKFTLVDPSSARKD